jgi:hypothetical protein
MHAAEQRHAPAVVETPGDAAGLLRVECSEGQENKWRNDGEPTEPWSRHRNRGKTAQSWNADG